MPGRKTVTGGALSRLQSGRPRAKGRCGLVWASASWALALFPAVWPFNRGSFLWLAAALEVLLAFCPAGRGGGSQGSQAPQLKRGWKRSPSCSRCHGRQLLHRHLREPCLPPPGRGPAAPGSLPPPAFSCLERPELPAGWWRLQCGSLGRRASAWASHPILKHPRPPHHSRFRNASRGWPAAHLAGRSGQGPGPGCQATLLARRISLLLF